MKKLELTNTTENVLNKLENDIIQRNVDVRNFLDILDYLNENTSIAINGDWGTGKTFFISQIKEVLTYKNPNISNNNLQYHGQIERILSKTAFADLSLENMYVPIYYNAWDNDCHSDPILSLIYTIAKEGKIDGYGKISKSTFEKIVSVADIFNIWSSGSLSKCVETFKGEDITNEIFTIESAKEMLKNLLNESLAENGTKLIIFIDELDRCNPIYAIKLLERIKHFLNDDRIIFVFTVNLEQLKNTVSTYYGTNFDSYKYLNKFFDLNFDMNSINIENYMVNIGLAKSSYYFDKNIYALVKYFNLSMRDCNRLMQSINIVRDYVHKDSWGFAEEKGIDFINIFILPVLLVLKVIDIKKFIEIIKGNGYDYIETYLLINDRIVEGMSERMRKDENKEVTIDNFKKQLREIYNVIFNNKGNEQYSSDKIIIEPGSKEKLMNVVSLLKKDLNYKD